MPRSLFLVRHSIRLKGPQSNLLLQISWKSAFMLTVTGLIIPSGLNKLASKLNTFQLEGGARFAEISRKFSAVRWFNKTEDCIFSRSFILRSNVQSFNILPSFNLTIYLAVFSQSIAIHNLFQPSIPFTESFLFIYPFRKYTPHCVYLRPKQLNVCHIL